PACRQDGEERVHRRAVDGERMEGRKARAARRSGGQGRAKGGRDGSAADDIQWAALAADAQNSREVYMPRGFSCVNSESSRTPDCRKLMRRRSTYSMSRWFF